MCVCVCVCVRVCVCVCVYRSGRTESTTNTSRWINVRLHTSQKKKSLLKNMCMYIQIYIYMHVRMDWRTLAGFSKVDFSKVLSALQRKCTMVVIFEIFCFSWQQNSALHMAVFRGRNVTVRRIFIVLYFWHSL